MTNNHKHPRFADAADAVKGIADIEGGALGADVDGTDTQIVAHLVDAYAYAYAEDAVGSEGEGGEAWREAQRTALVAVRESIDRSLDTLSEGAWNPHANPQEGWS